MSGRHKIQVAANLALVATFLASICIPLAVKIISRDMNGLATENRRLATLPDLALDRKGLARLPKQIETYYDDNFGLRNFFIGWHNHLLVKMLGISPSQQVIIGREGWLFYGGDHVLDDYRSTKPFSIRDLTFFQKSIEEREAWLRQRGIRYLLVLVPNKHTVYPEFLPRWVNRVGSRSRAEQLIDHMTANSLVNIVDLRTVLMTAKAEHRLYDKTGTHWNCYGALVGYEQLMSVVARWFPAMRVNPRQAFGVSAKEYHGGDLARMLSLADILPENVVTVRRGSEICPRGEEHKLQLHGKSLVMRIRRLGKTMPRLLMFGDSFGGRLVPYLSEHFAEIVFVGSGRFIPDLVRTERPDIVVEQMVERRLMKYRAVDQTHSRP